MAWVRGGDVDTQWLTIRKAGFEWEFEIHMAPTCLSKEDGNTHEENKRIWDQDVVERISELKG